MKKTWQIVLDFEEVQDENGNTPINAPLQYRINLEGAKGLDCDAIIGAAMFLTETVIKYIENKKNEQNSLQLEKSETTTENTGNGSIDHDTRSEHEHANLNG